MKKITLLLVVLMLFNFIFCNFSFAIDQLEGADTTFTVDDYEQLTNQGTTNVETGNGSETWQIGSSDSLIGSSSGMVASTVASPMVVVKGWLSKLVIDGGLYYTDSKNSTYNTGMFSICSLVFGEYLLFDGKPYQTVKSLNPSIETTKVIDNMDTIKTKIAEWYQLLRRVFLVLSSVMLVYCMARLIISDKAEDIAGWKKVLIQWLVGLIFIVTIQYVLIFINTIADKLMEIFWSFRTSLEDSGYSSFEVVIITNTIKSLKESSGVSFFAYAVEFVAFTVMQLIFFIKYMSRTLLMLFLFLIAPIIAVVNSFGLMRGHETTIMGDWLKHYVANVALQPVHAFLYLVFMFTASEIAVNAPLLGVLLLYALYRGEKIIRLMLGIYESTKLSSLLKKG